MTRVAKRQAPETVKVLPIERFSLADDVYGRITHGCSRKRP